MKKRVLSILLIMSIITSIFAVSAATVDAAAKPATPSVTIVNGGSAIKTASINVIKGFFACSLIGIVPIELYKFCIALQNTFAHGLTGLMVSGKTVDLSGESTSVLEGCFKVSAQTTFNLFNILCLIAFAYCVVKIFFQNIKRDGVLLIQIAVGALYMFSVPRGYTDGFVQWMKQVAAICLTAFLQTTILYWQPDLPT